MQPFIVTYLTYVTTFYLFYIHVYEHEGTKNRECSFFKTMRFCIFFLSYRSTTSCN